MKFHVLFLLALIAATSGFTTVSAQVNGTSQSRIDSVIGQLTNSPAESFAGGISGDGRFVVFESIGNLATENPRNADGNREIFLFDYAQRRIFQITDTKSLRNDPTGNYNLTNIKVLIINLRPVISNDGRWIAFGSNATTAIAGSTTPNTTNPGNFNAELLNPSGPEPNPNPLLADGNTEMWLYQIPATPAANLSAGDELAVTDLSAGTFTRITNTAASRVPSPGSATGSPIIADDNRDASIGNNGNYIAFTSNRDLVPSSTAGNAGNDANDEIFTYARLANQLNQITVTPRGTIFAPIINITPSISGNGLRVAFQSNADKPVTGIVESNTDRNIEVFFTDLDSNGAVSSAIGAKKKQITVTTRTNPGDVVNIFDFGRRMSRDGRYISLDSYADLQTENGGTNYTSFALYVYDIDAATVPPTTPPTNPFRRIGPRSNADSTVNGNEVPHFGGFTADTDSSGNQQSVLVFETRQNIKSDGVVAAVNDEGLNPNTARPTQIYAFPLTTAAGETPTYKRLTKFPPSLLFPASTQPIPSNSVRRMTFNLGSTEIGTGNPDLSSEAFYFLLPTATAQSAVRVNTFTGASRQIVSASPVPTPNPTVTPTPSPTPTPTTTPSPTPTPTPQTPAAVQGVSPGMLVTIDYDTGINNPVAARTAVGSLSRSFTLPIELSGVTLTINGAAAGLKSVSRRQITFVVPPALSSGVTGTAYPLVVNSSGVVFRSSITIIPTRPDIFTTLAAPAPNGRARIFNITNTVFRTEPFDVTTLRLRGGRRVPTVLRLFLTGVEGAPASITSIRIRDVTITPTTAAILREPGVYSFDFTLPATLRGAGDVPIIVTVTAGGVTFQSRLDDTAPQFRIL